MVFLGYILSPENQAEYMDDIKLAAKLEKNDILENAMKKVMQNQQQMSENSQQGGSTPDLEKTIKSIFATIKEPVNVDISDVIESKPPAPLDFEISEKIDELNRPLTAREEINVENMPSSVKLSKNISNESAKSNETSTSGTPTVASAGSDTPTVASTIGLEGLNTLKGYYDQIKDQKMGNTMPDFNETVKSDIKDILIKILRYNPDAVIYGAPNNYIKKPTSDHKLIILTENGVDNLVFAKKNKEGGFNKLKDDHLRKTIELNLTKPKDLNIVGQGLADDKIYIDLKDDNLVVKRSSKAKNKLIYLTDISPLLKKTILQMQKDKSFDLDIYDVLKASEKQVINKLITLLKLDTPDRVKSSIQDTIFNLKNRYEILLGEMRAGNDGKIVSDELKQVVIKLYDLKAIGLRKKNAILNALNE